MNRILFLLTILFFSSSAYAKCSIVPPSIKDDYASGMFEAFVTQSNGKSLAAFYQFDVAREKAKKAGENPLKLIAIERLFVWYRTYASSLKLYNKDPIGTDRIIGEYRPSWTRNTIPPYKSEWGNSPEQARIIRDFMFGVGEVVAGVFCASVSGGVFGIFGGGTVAFDRVTRMFNSLNALYALHETELAALREWENTALKPALTQ
jgi:hypothetical protein